MLLGFRNNHDSNMLSTARCILLVTPLEECTKRGAGTLVPYSFLKYEFAGRFENVTYQMIDKDTIHSDLAFW
jgi:hypothetical protein